MQFASLGFEAVNATLEDGQLGFELSHQATQLVGHFGDAVETSVQKGSRFLVGVAEEEGAVGVTGDAAVGLNQTSQSLIGPVGGIDVGELGDAGDLISGSRVIRNAVDVQLGISAGGQRPRAAGATISCWKSFMGFSQQKRSAGKTCQQSKAMCETPPGS